STLGGEIVRARVRRDGSASPLRPLGGLARALRRFAEEPIGAASTDTRVGQRAEDGRRVHPRVADLRDGDRVLSTSPGAEREAGRDRHRAPHGVLAAKSPLPAAVNVKPASTTGRTRHGTNTSPFCAPLIW